VVAGDQVAVATRHGRGAHERSDPAQRSAGESVRQGGGEGPISGGDLDLLAVRPSFEDRDLVAQGEDFGVLGVLAHGQRPEHRQRVGHAEVGRSR
jgi:hypothetical protein